MVLCCALGIASSAHAQVDLQKAEALLQAGNAAAAYSLLEPHEVKQAGDVRFDYLLGIAALDSGRADRATLAFERVLAVNPNHAGARLDMARAYFQLGDFTRARSELASVLERDPPPAARATVERFLKAIDEREKARRTVITGFAELTIGKDDNVNNSTSQAQVAVPALGNLVFTLDPTNVKRSDSYGVLAAGADVAHEIRPGLAVFGGGSGRYRANSSADRFDQKSMEAHGGIVIAKDAWLFRGVANAEQFHLDHEKNRVSTGLGGDLRYAFSRTLAANVFAQHSRFRFETAALQVNDFDQTIVGLGGMRVIGDGRGALNASVFIGREDEKNTRADGDKEMVGLRVGGQYGVTAQADLFASAGWQRGDYDRRNAAFLATRDDRQLDAVVGVTWKFRDGWSLRPTVTYIKNDSNIPIYAYKRTDYSITLRRDFR